MLRILLFSAALLCWNLLKSQCRTATADETCGTASGKLCKVKSKTTYGGKMEAELRSGEWIFTDEDGKIYKKGFYEIKDGFANRNGAWSWINENGKPFIRVVYKDDRPQTLTAIDSGIAVCGEDSAWVFSPDSQHFVIRFRQKNLFKAWVADELFTAYDLTGKAPAAADYKPVIGVIGKNEESKDASGGEPRKKNVIWTDKEIREIFPETETLFPNITTAVPEEQNLIRNSAFRPPNKKMADGKYTLNKGIITDWESGSETPDVFVENNEVILGFRVGGANYEVLKGRLKKSLNAGQKYCFSYKIKLKKDNNYCVNRIGAWFTHRHVMITDRSFAEGKGVLIRSPYAVPMALRDSWMTIESSFIARGDENVVYFSQFSSKDSSRFWPLDSLFDGSSNGEIYYYLKDPVLIEMANEADCICNADACPEKKEPVKEEVKKEDVFVLAAVQFNTAKWDLLETAYPALDSLADYLEEHAEYTLEIIGHTDNQGKPADNLKLSEKRAKTVYEYLATKGIAKSRMKYSGKGDTEPIEDNEEEEGRTANRRVEFRVRK